MAGLTSGALPKHGGRRQKGQSAVVLPAVASPAKASTLRALRPEPPAEWLEETRAEWRHYIESDEAEVAQRSALPALLRLFGYRDAHARVSAELATLMAYDMVGDSVGGLEQSEDGTPVERLGLVVRGSTGQLVLHPLTKLLGSLETAMRPLEDRFGLNPLARLRLGITMHEAASSLADFNERILDRLRVQEAMWDEPQPAPPPAPPTVERRRGSRPSGPSSPSGSKSASSTAKATGSANRSGSPRRNAGSSTASSATTAKATLSSAKRSSAGPKGGAKPGSSPRSRSRS